VPVLFGRNPVTISIEELPGTLLHINVMRAAAKSATRLIAVKLAS
jgi:hypothetical protein